MKCSLMLIHSILENKKIDIRVFFKREMTLSKAFTFQSGCLFTSNDTFHVLFSPTSCWLYSDICWIWHRISCQDVKWSQLGPGQLSCGKVSSRQLISHKISRNVKTEEDPGETGDVGIAGICVLENISLHM